MLDAGGLSVALNRDEQLAECPAHDPRDLHLGDTETAADLVLVQVVLEPELENAPLTVIQRGPLGR